MAIMRGETSVAANSRNDNVLDGEDFEFIDQPSVIAVALTQSATGLEADFKVNSEDVASRIVPNVASAAGIIRLDGQDVVIDELIVLGGRLKLPVENTTAGPLTLNWAVAVEELPEDALVEMFG